MSAKWLVRINRASHSHEFPCAVRRQLLDEGKWDVHVDQRRRRITLVLVTLLNVHRGNRREVRARRSRLGVVVVLSPAHQIEHAEVGFCLLDIGDGGRVIGIAERYELFADHLATI